MVVAPAAIGLIFAGSSLIVLSRREMNRFAQPTDPGHPTSQLITTGVFSISRNPIYLGGVVFLSGVTLALNSVWTLAALVISILGCQSILIIPEEKYLAMKFGEEYQTYTRAVHRWLGRK